MPANLDYDEPPRPGARYAFIRTCQSCGHRQTAAPPAKDRELTDAYRDAKCKRCKSADLDYGSEREIGNAIERARLGKNRTPLNPIPVYKP
jgi:hypothetical protein